MDQRMFQMKSKAPFSIGLIRLVCLISNHKKYHFLLELLSYVREKATLQGTTTSITTIEGCRLKYEKLSQTVQIAEKFLSFYLGINTFSGNASICFLSYNIITDWEQMSQFTIYVGYGIITLNLLIGGSSIVYNKVPVGYSRIFF